MSIKQYFKIKKQTPWVWLELCFMATGWSNRNLKSPNVISVAQMIQNGVMRQHSADTIRLEKYLYSAILITTV